MKAIRGSSCRAVALGVLFLSALLPGCSKKEDVGLDAASVASFSSAPPELKEKWKAAADCAGRSDYLGAATNLIDIVGKAQQLTAEQNEALTQAWTKLGNAAFAAANKGDKAATDAVLKMKDTGFGERRARQ